MCSCWVCFFGANVLEMERFPIGNRGYFAPGETKGAKKPTELVTSKTFVRVLMWLLYMLIEFV